MCNENNILSSLDGPVSEPSDDLYDFTKLAEGLSQSILMLDANVSTVIGIEGAWGSGKTSLLNLLMRQLKTSSPGGTHILQISPWLSAGGGNSIESLLLPVAAILDEEAEKEYSWIRRKCRQLCRSKASALATDMLRYAQVASGRVAPLAELAGNWVPGLGAAAAAMKTVSAADLSARRQTAAALRADIQNRISALNMNFIVVLDDLDRLEPAQAVEVLRLVRSVADFSRFRYVMCYDPAVLGHAVEQGLGVTDGLNYLQKIVQLSFPLPRPEALALQREFFSGAVKIFMNVNGAEPDKTILTDIRDVAGTFGATFITPREVRLALNALAFRYTPLRDFIWFPDLCMLQLLRVTIPDLYHWIEHYLTEKSVLDSGEGVVSEKEKEAIAKELTSILDSLPSASPLSVMTLRGWLPGIAGVNVNKPKLFGETSETEEHQRSFDRRLGSKDWWRYYFAFSPPKNILLPEFFEELFRMAASEHETRQLAEMLLDQVTSNGFSSRTRFEQVLKKLTPLELAGKTPLQCRGLVWFFFEYGDELINRYRGHGDWFAMYDIELDIVVDNLLRRLLSVDRNHTLDYLSERLKSGKALYWIANYLRHLVWQNGLAGNRPQPMDRRLCENDELRQFCEIFTRRLEDSEVKKRLAEFDDLLGFIFAWKDISTAAPVSAWIESVTRDSESFLQILLQLRYRGLSSATGYYRALRLSDIAEFFGSEEMIRQRLDDIEMKGNLPNLVQQVRESISLKR